jgi:hypothetical protein
LYKDKKDLLQALLDDSKTYTKKDIEQLIKKYEEGEVK